MSEYSLGDAMKQFLNKSRIKGDVQALQIEEAWEQIMGKTIAKYTEKIQIHGQTLYITTSMAPLKQELVFQKEKIIERVNDALGEKTIKEVVILWALFAVRFSLLARLLKNLSFNQNFLIVNARVMCRENVANP